MTHKTKRERKYASTYKFERIAALNELQDKGGAAAAAARVMKRAMSDSWTKRSSGRAGDLHKPNGERKRTDAGVIPARAALAPKPGSARRVPATKE